MRAKFIYEKFTDESDPIHDMSIGSRHLIEKWINEVNEKSKAASGGTINEYTIDDKGFINVVGPIYFPDNCGNPPSYIKFKNCSGSVFMNKCSLTTLKGSPKKVMENFFCNNNSLTSLKYAPEYVGLDFYCYSNALTSLKYAPKYVGGDFICRDNVIKFTIKDVRAVCNVKGCITV